jgi:hypothetical protein
MKLTRGKRIALEVLGPPALGASVWLVVIFVSQLFEPAGKDLIRFLRELPGAALFLLVAAYVFAGLQSVFYAVIMEWNFTAGLDPRSWKSVALSSLLGLCSGGVIPLVFSAGRKTAWEPWLLLGGLGLLVGLAMGLLIRACRGRKHETHRGLAPDEKIPTTHPWLGGLMRRWCAANSTTGCAGA